MDSLGELKNVQYREALSEEIKKYIQNNCLYIYNIHNTYTSYTLKLVLFIKMYRNIMNYDYLLLYYNILIVYYNMVYINFNFNLLCFIYICIY